MSHPASETPEMFITIIALLSCEDYPDTPMTGFMANTTDTNELYFHSFGGRGYSPSLIVKWDYLDEIAKEYALDFKHTVKE